MIVCTNCNDTGLEQGSKNKTAKICSFCIVSQNNKYALTYNKVFYKKSKNIFCSKNYDIYNCLEDAKKDQDFINKKYNINAKIIPI